MMNEAWCPLCGSADGMESWPETVVRGMPEEDRQDFGPFYRLVGGRFTAGMLYARCLTCQQSWRDPDWSAKYTRVTEEDNDDAK